MTMDLTVPSVHDTLGVRAANPLRGKSFHEHAVAFSEAFKIGDALTPEKFDEWAHQMGYLTVPTNAPKHSDLWLAHLQRRHQLRYSINKAATHPRMHEENRTPFVIEHAGNKIWEVRAVVHALQQNDTARKLTRLSVVQRRKLLYLQQSEDFIALPPYLRMAIKDISADITSTLEATDAVAKGLEGRLERIVDRVKAAIEEGEITPRNGGIKQLIANDDGEPTEE